MKLYPDRMVADLAALPGAQHSFLKQVCSEDGNEVRAAIDAGAAACGPVLGERLGAMLTSLDNRRFFQGFAELSVASCLGRAGWRVTELVPPGPRLRLGRAGQPSLLLSTLAFLRQTRPGGEEQVHQRLVEALGRVHSRLRFAVHVRRWLPHDFDPEPVRRAVEMWLQQVQGGSWTGRYAPYEDDYVSLEFALTGEKVKGRTSPLALAIGPFYAHRALGALEPRAVQEMDRHAASTARDQPMVLACVSDQPWGITPGYLRDFLYGRASRISIGLEGAEFEYGGSASVCAFRDPLYAGVSAVILIDRDPARPASLRAEAWLNPWANTRLDEEALGLRAFSSRAGEVPVLRWSAHPREVELG